MERVLGVLQEEGMKFPVIALAREQKVPAYKLAALKARFPETTFVNLNFEVNHSTYLLWLVCLQYVTMPLPQLTRWTTTTASPSATLTSRGAPPRWCVHGAAAASRRAPSSLAG